MPGTGYETASSSLCVWWDLSRKIGSFCWCFFRLCFGCKADGRMGGRSHGALLFALRSGGHRPKLLLQSTIMVHPVLQATS